MFESLEGGGIMKNILTTLNKKVAGSAMFARVTFISRFQPNLKNVIFISSVM